MLQSYCIQGFKSIKNATEVDLKKTQYQTLEKTKRLQWNLEGVYVCRSQCFRQNKPD